VSGQGAYLCLLDLIGRPWTLRVIDALADGPMRFGDLKAAVSGISGTMLARRLTELQSARLVLRRRLGPPASVPVYELTAWGYDGKLVLAALAAWASARPGPLPEQRALPRRSSPTPKCPAS
jgi:DNA-binding HxlR family transcriptional regulator